MPTHSVLGRSIGLSEAKMLHLLDDPLPADLYDAAEAAVIRYVRKSTRMEPIDDALYAEMARHFSAAQLVDLCFTVGLSNIVNRFHATFHTDLDPKTAAAAGPAWTRHRR